MQASIGEENHSENGTVYMIKTFDEKLTWFLFVVMLPLLLLFMSYYGFESSYTKFKTSERPPEFLFSSVYSYRVIPNYLSIYMTDFMEFAIDHYLSPLKILLHKNGTPFYHGLFLMNSFFLVLSSIVINKILIFKPTDIFVNEKVSKIIHLLAIFFIIITQYTPSNCDMIALFCYLTGVLLTIKYVYNKNKMFFYLLIFLIAISTFVRETACLNIAFFAAVTFNFDKLKAGNLDFLWKVFPLLLAFSIPYFGLRIFLQREEASFLEGIYVLSNFTSPFNLAGLVFSLIALSFFYNLSATSENRKIIKKFLFFSLPYVLMITFVGLFWEVRLFLPLILTVVIVAGRDFRKLYN